MKRKLIFTALIFVFSAYISSIAFQSRDYEFQSFQTEVMKVLNRASEKLSKDDIKFLESVKKRSPNEFGADYQQSVKKLQKDAEKKIQDFFSLRKQAQAVQDRDVIIKDQEKDIEQKETEITNLGIQLSKRDSIIQSLTNRLNRLEKERKSIEKNNQKLQNEAKMTKELLDNSTAQVNRIVRLIKPLPSQSEMSGNQIEPGIASQLQATECGVTELLKNNFLLTLKSMEQDEAFMDSISTYFSKNQVYPVELNNYLQSGTRLSDTLKASDLECSKKNGEEISNAIQAFREKIEAGSGGIWKQIANLLKKPVFIVILVLVVLIAASSFWLINLKKRKKPTDI